LFSPCYRALLTRASVASSGDVLSYVRQTLYGDHGMALVRGAAFALIASGLLLGGCSSLPFGGSKAKAPTMEAQLGIGVNAYLWRATLDTLSFMPLDSADPWGGVVNYDWYV